MLELLHSDADVREAVCTRASMLKRQGIDPALAYSAHIVRQIEVEQIARRSDEMAERAICGILIVVLLGFYFGWLA